MNEVRRQFGKYLAKLRRATGRSQTQFAAHLCELANTATLTRSEVSRWERGDRLPGWWLPYIAEAVGVPPQDLRLAMAPARWGQGSAPDDAGEDRDAPAEGAATLAERSLSYPVDSLVTVDTIAELGSADMQRRDVIKWSFAVGALAGPSRDWLLSMLEATVDERGPRKVGMAQVQGIRDMFRMFQEMDVMRGGGHARTALVEYLNSYVLPLVKRDHDPEVRRALFEAASEQTYLVGWMAYDDGQHGLAQRYLIGSLRFAQESGNAALGAHVLAGMSDQANLLGHPKEALALATAGLRGIRFEDSPACVADLHMLSARAHAAKAHTTVGDARASAHHIAEAERAFDRVVPENEPEWARFIDRAYLFGEAAHCFRDLGQPDQIDRFATDSANEARRQGRARRGALSNAALAVGDLERGEVESAADRGIRVVDLTARVKSTRCAHVVADLRSRFQPYNDVPKVQEFTEHARTLLGTAA